MKYSKRDIWKSDFEKQNPHERISRESCKRMNDGLIESVNKIVKENDILWFLGDFLFERDHYLEVAKDIRSRINCKTIHLLYGNHDRPSLAQVFNTAHQYLEVSIDPDTGKYWMGMAEMRSQEANKGITIALCHYASLTWKDSHKNPPAYHAFGHSHGSLDDWINEHLPGHKMMDVCVDSAYKVLGEYRPFSLKEFVNLLKDKQRVSIDHHEIRDN